MRVSVELIPRSETGVLADAQTVCTAMPTANAFNIPDLTRFALRSWEACALTRTHLPASIPHIRAIDLPPHDISAVGEAILSAGISEILVVKGDAPHDLSRRTYPNTSEAIIRKFKQEYPQLRVYAAFDPYRHSFRTELDGVARKLDAGADGFFTQPYFDRRLLEMSLEMLCGRYVFWGIAPVVGARSQAYWETTNQVVFPSGFTPTLHWNRRFAQRAIPTIQEAGGNIYFMPIRVDLASYLTGLF